MLYFAGLTYKPFAIDSYQSNKQGYLFNEWINTFEIDDKIAININPKMVFSGLGSLYAFWVSSNLDLSNSYQLVPELNISLSSLSQTNATVIVRRFFDEKLFLDLYLSSSSSFQDLGQLLSSDDIRKGIKISFMF